MGGVKWQIGPVKLANGWDATIYRYCENRKRYIGEVMDNDGWFFAAEWIADGSWYHKSAPNSLLDLAPPPKKTVRVQRWLVVYPSGSTQVFTLQPEAIAEAKAFGFALIPIDRQVTEGEGLT